MSPEVLTGLFGVGGVLVGGLVTWMLQKDRVTADLKIALEAVKTEHMAEQAVRYFLSHKGYTDRSFELIQKRIGGFEGDELRRLLVRAGAVRFFRSDKTEWWRLLERQGEAIAKARARAKAEDLGPENQDL
jgi:hypothetical protein